MNRITTWAWITTINVFCLWLWWQTTQIGPEQLSIKNTVIPKMQREIDSLQEEAWLTKYVYPHYPPDEWQRIIAVDWLD